MQAMIKNVKLSKLNTAIASVLLNTQTLKIIQYNKMIYVVTRIIKKI